MKCLAVGWQTEGLREANATIFLTIALNWICPMNGFLLAKPNRCEVRCTAQRAVGVGGCAFYTGHYDMRHSFPLRAVNKSFRNDNNNMKLFYKKHNTIQYRSQSNRLM